MYQGNDRVQQVNAIGELAANIADNLGEGTAEELVEFALSDEGRTSWGIELPEWFDDTDRALLIREVADNVKPARKPGRPRTRTNPVQRIQIRATQEEVDRIYQPDTRRRAEVLLVECERLLANA